MPAPRDAILVKHVLTVLAAEAEHPLQRLIGARLGWPPALALAQVAAGSVYVDGRRQRDATYGLRSGQKIVVFAPAAASPAAADPPSELAFLDAELAVLVKRAGVPTIATRRGSEPSVADEVRQRWGTEARVLHRLDRDVSGLLLISRRQPTRAALAEQVRAHTLQRRYLGIVNGQAPWRERVIELPLLFAHGLAQVAHHPAARPARTHLRLLAQRSGRALLAITLDTGRPHQIRAHLAAAGLPLLGDTRYGGVAAPRVALHAHALGLRHPRHGGWIELHSPLPLLLRQLWDEPPTRGPDSAER